ncbi:hypothetical protein A6770_37725 [Nostoc minutum NIES-26]|uniref:Nitrile hydratase alpha/Thiocyanate hydrolase gamma domain-containing protein n=1 Tax=Nostoc minutum NIES-26 TaxID=1844469 RepID=A0A367RY10_9NOSO|nr:hypothetical protein A6770_37725 [Nostoc minutum NIES-26]
MNNKGITPNLPLWSYQLQQNSKLAVKTRKDLEIHLVTRALKDKGFRQELIANPKAVVEKELETKLPKEIEINVLEETQDILYMVLPCNPYEEISEEELKSSLEMTYEDIAQWVMEQQRNAFIDENNGVRVIAKAWRDETFKQQLLQNPIMLFKQEFTQEIQDELQEVKIKMFVETANNIFILLPRDLMPPEVSIEAAEMNMLMIAAGSAGDTQGQNTPASKCTTNTVCCGVCKFFSLIYE